MHRKNELRSDVWDNPQESINNWAMQIRSLALTKRPIWIDVQAKSLEKFEIRASVRFWPGQLKSAALFLIDFETTPEPEVLSAHKIGVSSVGPYVYLDVPTSSGDLHQVISLPKGKIKRIGIRLWNGQDPILLENIEIQAPRAKMASEFAIETDVLLNDFPDFRKRERPEMLAVSTLLNGSDCNAYCHAICRNWYETMDNIAKRYRTNAVGRVNCHFKCEDGVRIPVTVFNGTPAMLLIPEAHERYLEKIGDKARNMIRKAQRQGYCYVKVDPDDHLDEVLAIRTSNPERQGKPIPDYYKVRPVRMIESPFDRGCKLHGEEFFGLFKEGVLVAYITIFLYGELGQVNHILGHNDHLQEGVMNLLVSEMVRELIETRPWIRAINFLYPHSSNANSGIGLFKKTIGFMPERLIVTDTERGLRSYLAQPDDKVMPKPVVAPSEKKTRKAMTSKAVKEAERSEEFDFPPKAPGRAAAIELALNYLNTIEPSSSLHKVKEWSHIDVADLHASGSHILLFEKIHIEAYQEFLSAGLKGFRNIIPTGAYLLFDFMTSLDKDHVPGDSGALNVLKTFFSRKGRRINQELIEYFSKRFKSIDLSIENVRTGFKGSDYVVAGLIVYKDKELFDDFDGLLVLRKIR
jgi:hypothetical protein